MDIAVGSEVVAGLRAVGRIEKLTAGAVQAESGSGEVNQNIRAGQDAYAAGRALAAINARHLGE